MTANAVAKTTLDLRTQRVLLDIQLKRGHHDEATQTGLAMLKLLETTDLKNTPGQQIVTATNGTDYVMVTINGQQTLQPINSLAP